MGSKWKTAGWVGAGVVAGALATVSVQTVARGNATPLPLQELQQFAAVYGMIKSSYVESTDDKKLITDAISGMVSGLDPHSQYYDKKAFKRIQGRNHWQIRRRGHRNQPGRRVDQNRFAH